ncbi:MAG TPA: hypothetical protein VLE95_07595 [Chlamydiales bacterium]|nr:hypothetical protein [Chlamydiales bacterium]
MKKNILKIAVMGIAMSGLITSCTMKSKSAEPQNDNASCSGKTGCKGTPSDDAKSGCKGVSGCTGKSDCTGNTGCKGMNGCTGKSDCTGISKMESNPGSDASSERQQKRETVAKQIEAPPSTDT